jgi:RNA polymerase sigma-70 factor (ECF subfamily)
MKVSPDPAPEALLRFMASGDEEAFRALYRQLSGGIYRFALHMCGSQSLAEDVTQEVFLMLIRDPGRFDPARGSLKAFLFGVARNHVLRSIERESRFAAFPDAGGETEGGSSGLTPASDRPDAGEDLLRRERIEQVRRAVLALPAVYREAVVLCDLHELSYEDAAATLACATGTLRSRLHRGREMLAAKLRASERSPARATAAATEERS